VSDGEDEDDDDDISDLQNEREDITAVEIAELEASILPVRLALTKVSHFKFHSNQLLIRLTPASQDCVHHQELHHNRAARMVLKSQLSKSWASTST